jgi:hypothetical protein
MQAEATRRSRRIAARRRALTAANEPPAGKPTSQDPRRRSDCPHRETPDPALIAAATRPEPHDGGRRNRSNDQSTLAIEESARQGLVDQYDVRRSSPIRGAERTPSDQCGSEGMEVVRRNDIEAGIVFGTGRRVLRRALHERLPSWRTLAAASRSNERRRASGCD